MENWWQEIMLCQEEKPECSKCPIDWRLDCKWYQDKNYDAQFKYSAAGKHLAQFENHHERGKY